MGLIKQPAQPAEQAEQPLPTPQVHVTPASPETAAEAQHLPEQHMPSQDRAVDYDNAPEVYVPPATEQQAEIQQQHQQQQFSPQQYPQQQYSQQEYFQQNQQPHQADATGLHHPSTPIQPAVSPMQPLGSPIQPPPPSYSNGPESHELNKAGHDPYVAQQQQQQEQPLQSPQQAYGTQTPQQSYGAGYPSPLPQPQGQQYPQQQQQQQVAGGFTHVMPLQALSRGPAPVDCPACGARGLTRTEAVSGGLTHLLAAGFCFFVCLGCIPYLISSLKNVEHYCSSCNALLATWHRSSETTYVSPLGGGQMPMQSQPPPQKPQYQQQQQQQQQTPQLHPQGQQTPQQTPQQPVKYA